MPTNPNNGGAGFKPAMAPVGPDLASVPFLPALAEGASAPFPSVTAE